ncbi:MAG: hypothetical protein ACE5FA_08260 [Dehalococcoidia bacterium]
MADTLAAQIDESTQEILDAALLMMPQYSPTLNLVTKLTIPKGKKEAELPFVNSFPTVVTPTEGEEITQTSQFDLSSVTITPTQRVIKVRVSKRAERFSQEQLIAIISDWLGKAQAINTEEDLIAEFQNFHSDNDLGGNTTDLALSLLRTARRLLDSVTTANGGPAPQPISTVIAPVAGEDLLTDIGTQGVVASTSPWIPRGLSEDLVRQFALQGGSTFQLVGTAVFISSALAADSYGAASGGRAAGMFSKQAIYHCISENWNLETFKESEWLGVILRTYADFDSGVGPYSRWGCFILTDGT